MDFSKNILQKVVVFWKNTTKKENFFYIALLIFIASLLLSIVSWTSPANFPVETTIQIKKGSTLGDATTELKRANYIKSEFWLKSFVIIFGGPRSIIAGDYYFSKKQTLFTIAWRIVHGDQGLTQIRVTIPEGFTNEQIANLLGEHFSLFNKGVFIKNALQGKMFPDTYFFLANVTANDVIDRIKLNFEKKIGSINSDFLNSKRTFDQILIMASILEEEAKTKESRKMIADILWRRLDIGMALQVDSDLGTYESNGLPKFPISNPGLEAILDAIYPTKNDYLYFLTDKKGNMYYARDFEGHQKNRELYFKK